jgi:amidophosphoribosyltransferase
MYRLAGAYPIVVMSPQKLIAARDPNGFRPLSLGRLGEDSMLFLQKPVHLTVLVLNL